MGWLIALAVVLLLAALPLGVRASYLEGGPKLVLLVGPVRYTLYPRKKKKTKANGEKTWEKPKASSDNTVEKPVEEEKGGSWKDFLPLIKTVLAFLGDFRKKLRIHNLRCCMTLAGDDPCDLAINYGRAWAALGNLMAVLERVFVIRKRDVQVQCDFTGKETCILAQADITISLGRLLVLAARYGIRAWKDYLNLRKSRKGGMKYE